MLNFNASRNSDTKSWITLMGTKSGQNFQNFFFFLFSQKCYLSLVCLKKNTKSLIECGIRLSPNSLLKPNSESCDNPEFSSRVLRFFLRTFVRDLYLHFPFTLRTAPHSRSEFVTYSKTVRNKSLHEMGKIY